MLIKNGYIIDPASGRAEFADLQISDGKIFSIGQHLSVSPSEEIIDASGLTIAPGLIDTHVHFRDPGFTYKEDIHTGASASAAGGFTSVICMANTSPVVDSVSVFSGLAAREKEEAIHHDELLEHYLDGLKMLMSIGYELRIDTIKNHTEIPNHLSLEDLFLKIYQSMMNVSSTYSSQDYQNTIDDYFSLGFQLGIDLDEIIDHI